MSRSDAGTTISCASCGTGISDEGRVYAFGEHSRLCWSCGMDRGGSYDGEEERWVTPPRTHDLPLEDD